MNERLGRIETNCNTIRRMYVQIFSAEPPLDADPEIYSALIKMNNLLFEIKEDTRELKEEYRQLQGKQIAEETIIV